MHKILNLVSPLHYMQIKELPVLCLNPHTIISELNPARGEIEHNDLLLSRTQKGWALCKADENGPIVFGPGRFRFTQKPLPGRIDLASYGDNTILRILIEDSAAFIQEITADED
ncbi:MAG: hypothetical protein PF637_14550 [Spirochaetes bacterium]|nr:hypothetical protein [Spirochaetota bacterium]